MKYCKDIANLILSVFWECLIMPSNDSITLKETLIPKVLKSTCRKFWGLSACKNSTSSVTSFLRYCQDIVNLLFWKLWQCLINLLQAFMLICMQKTNLINHFLLKILQRNRKLVILGNLGIPGHRHLKW